MKESSSSASCAGNKVRRVAKKSTRPPQKPQRSHSLGEDELLLLESRTETRCESEQTSKRKSEQCDLHQSHRKVARKSTRPPANPQKQMESEVVDIEDDEEIMEIPRTLSTSLLLESPSHQEELEEIVLS